MFFPSADPIPVPAPVWLMKLLSLVTLALHFSAVMILVGSLVLICCLNLAGRSLKSADQISASFVLARRLPVIMTFVVNLGIPPLLFAQVLYGRALYTSSILIAVTWLSVIFLVMADYWLLYRIGSMIEAKRRAWPVALLALLITLGIGHIYSMNMTLMLRPQVWPQMYAQNPMGLSLGRAANSAVGDAWLHLLPFMHVRPHGAHDPTTTPRWLFVMCGGLVFGGLWALTLSNMRHIEEGIKTCLRRTGGAVTVIGAAAQIGCALTVVRYQPEVVRQGLGNHALYHVAGLLFLATAAVAALLALLQGAKAISNPALATVGLLVGFLSVAGAVIYRDGIRDLTLKQVGFNVWDRIEVSNWSVIGLFLLLFVVMIGAILWLLNVMRQATPPTERVTP
jgi:hypothetical protein